MLVASALEFIHQRLDVLSPVARADQQRVGGVHHDHVAQAERRPAGPTAATTTDPLVSRSSTAPLGVRRSRRCRPLCRRLGKHLDRACGSRRRRASRSRPARSRPGRRRPRPPSPRSRPRSSAASARPRRAPRPGRRCPRRRRSRCSPACSAGCWRAQLVQEDVGPPHEHAGVPQVAGRTSTYAAATSADGFSLNSATGARRPSTGLAAAAGSRSRSRRGSA